MQCRRIRREAHPSPGRWHGFGGTSAQMHVIQGMSIDPPLRGSSAVKPHVDAVSISTILVRRL
jgi:hypothetical protein